MKTNMLSDFHICISVSLFWMGLLGAAHRKDLKAPSPPPPTLPKMLHISHNNKTWHTYTLLKKIQQIYKSCDTNLPFCEHRHLIFVISRCTDENCILIVILWLFWLLLIFKVFNQLDCNFDGVSKICYCKPP